MFCWPKKLNFPAKKESFYLVFLCLVLHEGRPKLQENLQHSKENIQHFKTWNSVYFFLFLWVIFAISWIRSRIQATKTKADPCGSASTDTGYNDNVFFWVANFTKWGPALKEYWKETPALLLFLHSYQVEASLLADSDITPRQFRTEIYSEMRRKVKK